MIKKIGGSEGLNPAYFPDGEDDVPKKVGKVEPVPKTRKGQDRYDKEGIGKEPFPTYNRRGEIEQTTADKHEKSEENPENEK
ncbi:hypothetical protein DRH29_00275 [candidate division Kazan bacterium]|uniref:Uncharacterized protein n=1 Tax=candidate division Kazan bacterium TaxID=2202143 RepID=A0A420ZDT2_UNCK3|nr:MAG: hypothetical protein DRH29_00275 [candidate division Kazan bacterium]